LHNYQFRGKCFRIRTWKEGDTNVQVERKIPCSYTSLYTLFVPLTGSGKQKSFSSQQGLKLFKKNYSLFAIKRSGPLKLSSYIIWNENQLMSLFYSYIAGSLHISGPQAHLQEISYSCSHNHWFSICAALFACSVCCGLSW